MLGIAQRHLTREHTVSCAEVVTARYYQLRSWCAKSMAGIWVHGALLAPNRQAASLLSDSKAGHQERYWREYRTKQLGRSIGICEF